ncbi:MAG: ATP-binding protein [bacterium]
MLRRDRLKRLVERSLAESRATCLLGPRQCGKTTLARQCSRVKPSHHFDLEDPDDLLRLERDAKAVLQPLKGLVVIDEIQRLPTLLPLLRVLLDRRPLPARFLILGSASPDLVRGASESLAGRVRFVDMGGFTLEEAGKQKTLWLRGGFPGSFLARTDDQSLAWREDYIRTFLERDIPQLEVRLPASTLRRFWTMVGHYHGQTWNASEIAASMGLAHTTARRYLDLLTGAYALRQLLPLHNNLSKRLVKAPKVYVRDSGLFHSLLGIRSLRSLQSHPKFGASWEGFALEQVLALSGDRHASFWATHAGAELDLVLEGPKGRVGIEFKAAGSPAMTRSLHEAFKDLGLKRAWIVHPGSLRGPIHEKVEALPLESLPELEGWIK